MEHKSKPKFVLFDIPKNFKPTELTMVDNKGMLIFGRKNKQHKGGV